EIRVQIDQVDRAVQFHGSAAEELLGSAAGIRIWILGERESAGTASALEPGDGRADRAQRAAPDFAVQRLWRIRRRSLPRSREGAALGVGNRPCPVRFWRPSFIIPELDPRILEKMDRRVRSSPAMTARVSGVDRCP